MHRNGSLFQSYKSPSYAEQKLQARCFWCKEDMFLLLLSLLIPFGLVAAVHGGGQLQYLQVDLRSQMPANNCSSHQEPSGNSLKVAPRYGPCSPHAGSAPTYLLLRKLLNTDQLRVDSLQQSLLLNSSAEAHLPLPGSQSSIPARRGIALDTANYVITLGLGTPRLSQTVVFDTGSHVSWVQCKPCSSCHRQNESVFDPVASATYRNISCISTACSLLARVGCSSGTCLYGVAYGDGSSTVGFLGEDTLTLASSDVFTGFVFGCGQSNRGLFGKESGLVGLSRDALSLVSQTSHKYGRVFSYCLPFLPSSTGDLTFGPVSGPVNYTAMLSDGRAPSLYFLQLTAISVGGRVIPVPSRVFTKVGTIIDSGTIVTRLPKAAYAALRAAFRIGMKRYKLVRPVSILDTCYDFKGIRTVSVPSVALHFGGGAKLELGFMGSMYVTGGSRACLAFAGNTNDADVSIIGNQQQVSTRVVYDLGASRIGFAKGTCG